MIDNSVRLIGNLGADPETKVLENGSKLSKMSLATSEKYVNKEGEYVEKTNWHKVIAWGKLAGIVKTHLHKGKKIAVEGKLVHRKYEDPEGKIKTISEVIASSILMLDKVKKK